MIKPGRALAMNMTSSPKMPHSDRLRDLYAQGWVPRRGELTLVAGRPGCQKSGFTMWLCEEWGLPTLYFSGDMSARDSSARIASMHNGMTSDDVEKAMLRGDAGYGRDDVLDAMDRSCIRFVNGPITFRSIEAEVEAWVELNNEYPAVIVIDNLCDVENCESDYAAQMEAMADFAAIKTDLGINVIVLHHATEATWSEENPWKPPARKDIKNKLGEKPECALTCALNPNGPGGAAEFNIAIVKQRSGPCDPSGSRYATLKAYPQYTRFRPTSALLNTIGGA